MSERPMSYPHLNTPCAGTSSLTPIRCIFSVPPVESAHHRNVSLMSEASNPGLIDVDSQATDKIACDCQSMYALEIKRIEDSHNRGINDLYARIEARDQKIQDIEKDFFQYRKTIDRLTRGGLTPGSSFSDISAVKGRVCDLEKRETELVARFQRLTERFDEADDHISKELQHSRQNHETLTSEIKASISSLENRYSPLTAQSHSCAASVVNLRRALLAFEQMRDSKDRDLSCILRGIKVVIEQLLLPELIHPSQNSRIMEALIPQGLHFSLVESAEALRSERERQAERRAHEGSPPLQEGELALD
ncbi:hypothetical protein BDZ85DRAFT_279588 [Elsinoe ampelina]|uniref:Uncharacterized protein n=1 Tax=Elsinoe ampelina TaxID=302913 RepID=A0A6A6GJV4_9PEZI|nr:hypothetical protein BDZ85DRAFT_279588 [Elsinoe ampelina]